MPKKNWTEEEKKKFAEKMAAARKAKQTIEVTPDPEPQVAPDQSTDDLRRQVKEMSETMELMRQAMLNKNNQQNGVSMDRQGELVGEFEKYITDPDNYPDPTPRLAAEDRLRPLAFDYNYELEYSVGVSAYQTKSGKNIREPKFNVTLNRIVLDEQGNQTPKRYIARKMVFHEDPEAALVIAREQNIPVDKSDQRLFLNEMRYLRVRDWLFGIFWPQPSDPSAKIHEEVIGGSLVQVFTKNSVEPSAIPFDQMKSKLQA